MTDQPCAALELVAAGQAALASGAWQDAVDLAEHAAAITPGATQAWTLAGLALQQGGRHAEAGAAFGRALCLDPGNAVARNAFALLLQARRQIPDAMAGFALAIRHAPRWFVPHVNLGLLQQRQGDHAAALPLFEEATRLAPAEPATWHCLGTARQFLRDPEGAEAAYRRTLALQPDHADAHANLGRALRDQGRVEDAAAAYRQAIALQPGHAGAHWNAGILAMLQGDFAQGWDEMEWRWRIPGFPSPVRDFAQPLWNGEAIDGRRILLHAEQGFGDTLQCLRYVAMVAARGAEVILEVQPELRAVAIAAGLPARILVQGDPLPDFDLHCPMLSLPRAFATRLDTVPAAIPYLAAPAEARRRWETRLPRDGGAPRLGLVWAGRPTHANDANRSIGLAALAPVLADLPWRIASLQLGAASAEIAALGLDTRIEDLSPALTDFGETAAALDRIDLLVTVDTAVAHLAGALGRPALLLLPHAPDWRWMLGREDTPWYPAMRLLRQHRPGDWSAPLAALAQALSPATLLAAE